MRLSYREIQKSDYAEIVKTFGPIVEKYSLVQFKKNCYNIIVLDGNKIVGIITNYIKTQILPLKQKEGFIAYIEVLKEYRRKGIATRLVKMAEKWAKSLGLYQIGSWSDLNAKEMILFAKKQKYSMCQAIMYDENYLPKNGNYVVGYYYAKRLD